MGITDIERNPIMRRRWLLFLTVLALLLVLLLAKYTLSVSTTLPPGVPEGWKCHREILGAFELWLPEEWESLGSIRTLTYRLQDVAKGKHAPLLFAASWSNAIGDLGVIYVQGWDRAFDDFPHLKGQELAWKCVSISPAPLLDESGRNVFPEPLGDIVTIEQDEDGDAVAYQSFALAQNLDKNLIRTSACAVSKNHVYIISLDTVEQHNSEDIPTYETILNAFQVLE
jgi:hypothetical protein